MTHSSLHTSEVCLQPQPWNRSAEGYREIQLSRDNQILNLALDKEHEYHATFSRGASRRLEVYVLLQQCGMLLHGCTEPAPPCKMPDLTPAMQNSSLSS